MFWIIRFILCWVIFILFANKERWREILPVCLFAALLGSSTDIVMHQYHLWYYDNMENPPLLAELTDDWSIYIVVTYLFIQWLPKLKNFRNMFIYWLIWTTFAIVIELIHVAMGHMFYSGWWNIWWSLLSDWILFYMFYKLHNIYKVPKNSNIETFSKF